MLLFSPNGIQRFVSSTITRIALITAAMSGTIARIHPRERAAETVAKKTIAVAVAEARALALNSRFVDVTVMTMNIASTASGSTTQVSRHLMRGIEAPRSSEARVTKRMR